MKKNQNMMILDKLIVYKTKSMKNGIIKVPSYLIDMVVFQEKKLMLMSEDITIITLDKKNLDERIIFAESVQYEGRLFGKNIKYHLTHVNTLNSNTLNHARTASSATGAIAST